MNDDIRQIPGFVGYYADRAGNVYSQWTLGRFARIDQNQLKRLKPTSDPRGYSRVSLKSGTGGFKPRLVHRLIALAFIGECQDGHDVCHNNGNPSDNRIENLRYDTRKGNKADEVKHGTRNYGERNGCAKLTNDDLQIIKNLIDQGCNDTKIAAMFGVSHSTISYIHRGETWNHAAPTDAFVMVNNVR